MHAGVGAAAPLTRDMRSLELTAMSYLRLADALHSAVGFAL